MTDDKEKRVQLFNEVLRCILKELGWESTEEDFAPLVHDIQLGMEVLGFDELSVLKSYVDGYHGQRAIARLPFARSISSFVERLLVGRLSYGELEIASDERDWAYEKALELADAAVYHHIGLTVARRKLGGPGVFVVTDQQEMIERALVTCYHRQKAGRIRELASRRAWASRPADECFGSGKHITPAMVIAALDEGKREYRCHHCNCAWDFEVKLRRSPDQQIEIPRHRPHVQRATFGVRSQPSDWEPRR